MAEPKAAKRVVTLEDIKFNEANKGMAIASCIPVVGLVLFFVEKDDLFVKYHAAQYFLLGIAMSVLVVIPCLGWILALVGIAMIIMGMVKISKGQRSDLPLLSDLALKML